ncbi:MAG TPA: hypothetical protein DCY10_06680 [Clostridiales bacterium]|nr:hypothetical protein [Clostridiales bacterium]
MLSFGCWFLIAIVSCWLLALHCSSLAVGCWLKCFGSICCVSFILSRNARESMLYLRYCCVICNKLLKMRM